MDMPMTRREFFGQAGAAAAAPAVGPFLLEHGRGGRRRRPNIVLVIADDWSWPHAGAYGDRVVRTPAFDRLAREGVLFTRAYCAAPSCTPSRGAILTGQMFYRLRQAANLWSTFPADLAVYPDLLEGAGYAVGLTGKGWAPGTVAPPRTRNPAGPPVKDFRDFLKGAAQDRPFCYWFGSSDPHRPYAKGSGARRGKRIEDVNVPPYLADSPEVRSDILDYYAEVERFDGQVGAIVKDLQDAGRLDETLLVVTSDNGWPFPRGKTTLYDSGCRMPMVVRWGEAPAGRTIEDFVNLADLAPTFLEAAGLDVPRDVTARSFLDLLVGGKSGRVDPQRDATVVGRERHHGAARPGQLGYPSRAIHTAEFLYVRNFEPGRGPAGEPGTETWPGDDTVGGYADVDGGPTKAWMWQHRADPAVKAVWDLAVACRPAEELYDLKKDPHQVANVAGRPEYAAPQKALADRLAAYLRETGDPRIVGGGEPFDEYPYVGAMPKAAK
jgi:uncharacterized sulfatase